MCQDCNIEAPAKKSQLSVSGEGVLLLVWTHRKNWKIFPDCDKLAVLFSFLLFFPFSLCSRQHRRPDSRRAPEDGGNAWYCVLHLSSLLIGLSPRSLKIWGGAPGIAINCQYLCTCGMEVPLSTSIWIMLLIRSPVTLHILYTSPLRPVSTKGWGVSFLCVRRSHSKPREKTKEQVTEVGGRFFFTASRAPGVIVLCLNIPGGWLRPACTAADPDARGPGRPARCLVVTVPLFGCVPGSTRVVSPNIFLALLELKIAKIKPFRRTETPIVVSQSQWFGPYTSSKTKLSHCTPFANSGGSSSIKRARRRFCWD